MKNLFENAHFGKAYKTKDGSKALLLTLLDDVAYLRIEAKIGNTGLFGNLDYEYRLDGICKQHQHLDIFSEWQEEIDEEELDELAHEYVDNSLPLLDGDAISCFKAGYRKALEK